MPATELIHICVPHGTQPLRQWCPRPAVEQDRSARLRRLASGIVVASGSRLAFDLASDLSTAGSRVGGRAVDPAEGVHHRGARSYGPSPLPSNVAQARSSSRRTLIGRGDRPASESHPELVLGEALRTRGVPVQPQFRDLDLADGSRVRHRPRGTRPSMGRSRSMCTPRSPSARRHHAGQATRSAMSLIGMAGRTRHRARPARSRRHRRRTRGAVRGARPQPPRSPWWTLSVAPR